MFITINSNNITFVTDATSLDDVIQRTDISSITQNYVPQNGNNPDRPGNRPQTCQIIITLNSKRKIAFDLADINNRQAGWTLDKAGLNAFIASIAP